MLSLKDIKSEARASVQGIEFNLFIPIFLIMLVSGAVTATFIGGIVAPAFNFVISIFVYNFLNTGKRDFNALISDYRNFDNIVEVLKSGLRLFLYMLPFSIGIMVLSLFVALIENVVLMVVLVLIFAIIAAVGCTIISYMYFFVPYILKDSDFRMSSADIFKLSKAMTNGNKMNIFKLQLYYFGEIMLSVITLGIYSIWLIPRMQSAYAVFYREAKKQYLATHNDILSSYIRGAETEEDAHVSEFDEVSHEFENSTNHSYNADIRNENIDPFSSEPTRVNEQKEIPESTAFDDPFSLDEPKNADNTDDVVEIKSVNTDIFDGNPFDEK